MSLFRFHKHVWVKIGYEYRWLFDDLECWELKYDNSKETVCWDSKEVYSLDNPGRRHLVNCMHPAGHYQEPTPQTIIQQRCTCGKYRTQTLLGILEDNECE